MTAICELHDLQKIYHRRVPKMFQGYCESGSWQMRTLAANMDDFARWDFRQRVGRNLEDRSLETELFGAYYNMPLIGAPVGLLGMQHADGEIKAARAFAKFGVPFTLSTMSICSIEQVARAADAPFWFQLYVMRDKEFTHGLIKRARAAECSALVVTLDLQIIGKRHADIRNGLTAPPRLSISNMIDIARRPAWAFGMLATKNRAFGNIQGHAANVDDMNDLMKWTASQFDQALNWDDLKRFRDEWEGPLIVKGIMEVEDAKQAIACGADGIVVSNHGGRQLDGAPSSISVLPEIVEAVGKRTQVLIDSGIRSGQDMLKAVALGARGVMIGRPMVYALGAGGERGVERLLEIFYEEADLSMAFCGERNLDDVGAHILREAATPRHNPA